MKWCVILEDDDGELNEFTGDDFAPDIAGYLNHFMREVVQYKAEQNEGGNHV